MSAGVEAPLVRQFDLLATAPGGVARLRELILTLAVQGKLVPQDPRNESAILTLDRVQRSRKSKRKIVKFDPETIKENGYEIPHGWVWASIDEISADTDTAITDGPFGANLKTDHYIHSRGFRVIRLQNIGAGFFKEEHHAYIDENRFKALDKHRVFPGDVVVAGLVAEVIRCCVVPSNIGPAIVKADCYRFAVHEDFSADFLRTYLSSGFAHEFASIHHHGLTLTRIGLGNFRSIPVALPPPDEQRRIVTRVEELMRLCDALEHQRQLETAQRAQLLNTLLGTLTDCTSPDELAANWQRVSDHFDLLFDRPEAVDALEKTILQLAVRGRLVPQDPADEPASVLLQRIKRDKPLPALTVGEIPFDLPSGWQWARFDELIDPLKPVSYGVLVPGPEVPGGVPFVRIADLSITNPAAQPEKSISPEISAQYQRTRLEGGEILMGVVGSIGKLGVAPKSWAGANIARAVCRIVPVSEVRTEFVLLLLESEFMQKNFSGDTRTLAQPTLNVGLIRSAPTPLPPLAEQTRIVARVTQLRDLCTTLRQRLAAGQTTQRHLAEALVEV